MKIRDIEIELHPNEALSNHIRREQDFFEIDILEYLKENYKNQKTIVDVGANIGNHAVYFANFFEYQKIICFEPIEENFSLLANNLKKYSHIELHKLALSNKDETLKASINQGNMGASKIDQSGSLDVKAITLDSLNLQDVSLLKIDVEDYEPWVLEGAKETINRCHPQILIEDRLMTYGSLLPGYQLEKSWPKSKTYLYTFQTKTPYLISIYSYTPGVDNYKKTLPRLQNSVEPVEIVLDSYPGHLLRWDLIPNNLDNSKVFIFTDTSDVIFQKPVPSLSPEFIYVASEREIFKNNRFWRSILRRHPQFNHLENEIIYNVGTFACSGTNMQNWISYLQKHREGIKTNVVEQLIFNDWLHQPEIKPLITELPDLFTSVYANLEKGYAVLNSENQFENQSGQIYSIVHFNGSTKALLNPDKMCA